MFSIKIRWWIGIRCFHCFQTTIQIAVTMTAMSAGAEDVIADAAATVMTNASKNAAATATTNVAADATTEFADNIMQKRHGKSMPLHKVLSLLLCDAHHTKRSVAFPLLIGIYSFAGKLARLFICFVCAVKIPLLFIFIRKIKICNR